MIDFSISNGSLEQFPACIRLNFIFSKQSTLIDNSLSVYPVIFADAGGNKEEKRKEKRLKSG